MSGLNPSYSQSGTIRDEGAFQIQSGYATSIFSGDPVVISGGYVTLCAADAPFEGVFRGCSYRNAEGRIVNSAYWPANTVATDIVAYVQKATQDTVYEIEADESMAITSIGKTYDFVIGSGNVRSGQSTTKLDGSTGSSGKAATVVGIRKGPREDRKFNDWGVASTRVLVKPAGI